LCAAKIDLLILIENLREEECWLLGLCFSDKILKFKNNVVVMASIWLKWVLVTIGIIAFK
jgi:hypothetical protein